MTSEEAYTSLYQALEAHSESREELLRRLEELRDLIAIDPAYVVEQLEHDFCRLLDEKHEALSGY